MIYRCRFLVALALALLLSSETAQAQTFAWNGQAFGHAPDPICTPNHPLHEGIAHMIVYRDINRPDDIQYVFPTTSNGPVWNIDGTYSFDDTGFADPIGQADIIEVFMPTYGPGRTPGGTHHGHLLMDSVFPSDPELGLNRIQEVPTPEIFIDWPAQMLEVSWLPLAQDGVDGNCDLDGEALSTPPGGGTGLTPEVVGFNVYRLNTGTVSPAVSTPMHYLCGPDLDCNTPDDNGFIGFISNTPALDGRIHFWDDTAFSGGAIPSELSYVVQPVLSGAPNTFWNGIPAEDLDDDGVPEFLDPLGRGRGLVVQMVDPFTPPTPHILISRDSTDGGGPLPCTPIVFDSDIQVSTVGDCELEVSWSPASGGSGGIAYDVYRSTSSPVAIAPANLIASDLSEPGFLDLVGWGSAYGYRVVARDRCTNPAPQEEPNAGGDSPFVEPIDETGPEFAGVTDTEDAGFCNVLVHWDDLTFVDDCSGLGEYTIYRDNGVGHAGETPVGTASASPYEDETPGNGTWVYVVRGTNGAGLSEDNTVFIQESENSCTNNFPKDAGMSDENNVDPPNADKQKDVREESLAESPSKERILRPRVQRTHDGHDIQINWERSEDEGGLYPISYSVLRGSLDSLHSSGLYTYSLVDPLACGITDDYYIMDEQLDGESCYYVVVPVSGDNATFGYDSNGIERAPATVCE